MITLTAQIPAQDRHDDRHEPIRWIVCGVIALLAHAAVAAALMQWREPLQEGDLGNDTILLELMPEQIQAEPTPEKPVEKVEEKPDPLPEQPSDVTLAQTPTALQPQPTPREDISPAPATTAEQIARARASVQNWKSQIAAILEHNKRYPQQALSRGQQGVAQLAFSIDRQGHVLSSRIVTSSGSAALDEETLALVQRSQPFPLPPPELAGDELRFTVPIRFKPR